MRAIGVPPALFPTNSSDSNLSRILRILRIHAGVGYGAGNMRPGEGF